MKSRGLSAPPGGTPNSMQAVAQDDRKTRPRRKERRRHCMGPLYRRCRVRHCRVRADCAWLDGEVAGRLGKRNNKKGVSRRAVVAALFLFRSCSSDFPLSFISSYSACCCEGSCTLCRPLGTRKHFRRRRTCTTTLNSRERRKDRFVNYKISRGRRKKRSLTYRN